MNQKTLHVLYHHNLEEGHEFVRRCTEMSFASGILRTVKPDQLHMYLDERCVDAHNLVKRFCQRQNVPVTGIRDMTDLVERVILGNEKVSAFVTLDSSSEEKRYLIEQMHKSGIPVQEARYD